MMQRLTAKQVVTTAREYLHEGRPLSVIRLGDGEARVLGWPEFISDDLLQWQLKNIWFGRHFSTDEMSAISNQLRDAVSEADILGLPTRRHLQVNEEYKQVEQFLDSYNLIAGNALIANCDFHRRLQEQNLFRKLLAELDHVYLLTCRDIGEKVSNEFDVPVIQIPIPGEARSVGWSSGHYPERFEQLREYLARPLKGKLVLIGAGVLGKIYAAWIKQSGGVSIDVGSILDGWAGIQTRGYMRNNRRKYSL